MKVIYSALLLLFSFQSLLSENLGLRKCEDFRKGIEKDYPACLKIKKNHPCEVVKNANSWKDVLALLKGKGVIQDPTTLIEYAFDGENIEYTITYEKGTMMANKFGVQKIQGYIKIINENEVAYSLLESSGGPCKGIANKVSCLVMQAQMGPVLYIGFEGKADRCNIVTYSKVGLDEMKSERTFTSKNSKKP